VGKKKKKRIKRDTATTVKKQNCDSHGKKPGGRPIGAERNRASEPRRQLDRAVVSNFGLMGEKKMEGMLTIGQWDTQSNARAKKNRGWGPRTHAGMETGVK